MNHSLPPVSTGRGLCPPPSPRSPLASALLSAVTTVALLSGSLALSASAQVAAPEPGIEPPKPAVTAETDPDAIGQTVTFDTFVVSGTIAPRRKLDSAAAITTIDLEQMKSSVPIGLPELIKQIPGIYVVSAGGEARANVYARGLPASGGYVFVGLQNDGLPDISEMNYRNIQPDILTRATSFVQRIENVRGGTAGVFQSNVPGGIINLIPREGTSARQGEISVQTTDYAQIKAEGWTSGPIDDATTYAAGVTYRKDDGVRSAEYTANEGYIFQGNIKRTFADGRGSLKIDAKYLEDRSIFYLAVPMQDASAPHAIPGFDYRTGTQNSEDIRRLAVPNTPAGNLAPDLKDGAHPTLATVGGALELKLGGGFRIQERVRYTDLVYKSTTLLTSGVATPIQSFVDALGAASAQFASAKNAANANHYTYRLHYPGQGGAVVTDPTTLNGNGLAINMSMSDTYTRLTNLQNDFRLLKTLPREGVVALGLYNSWLKTPKALNYFHTFVTEVKNNPSRLDVEFVNASTGDSLGYATYNGFRQVSGSGSYRNFSSEQKDIAPYLNIEQPLGDWTFDGGVRMEVKTEDIERWLTQTYNLNTTVTNTTPGGIPALRNAGFAGATKVATSYRQQATTWTAGANYRFNQRLSAYGRYTNGYRMPISDDYIARLYANPSNDSPGPINRIYQAEAGMKYVTRKLSVFGTLIGSKLKNQLFSGLVADPVTGILSTRNVSRDTDIYGVEVEVFYNPIRSVTLHFTGTEQSAKFSSHNLVTDPSGTSPAIDIKGNRVIIIPNRYSSLAATYRAPEDRFGGKLTLVADWVYTGSSAIDEANRSFLPGYSTFNAGLSYAWRKATFRFNVKNLLDDDSLTNGDARSSQVFSDPSAAYLNARAGMPRSFVGSVTYSF